MKVKFKNKIFSFSTAFTYQEKLVDFEQTPKLVSFFDTTTRNVIILENIDTVIDDMLYIKNLEPETLDIILQELLEKGYYDLDIINYPVVEKNNEEEIKAYKTGKPYIITEKLERILK